MQINITNNAAERIKQLKSKKGGESILHITVKSGGCSGKSYDLFMSPLLSNFMQIDSEFGPLVAIDQSHAETFNGSTIDFIKGVGSGKFKITGINAKSPCRCGSSFA